MGGYVFRSPITMTQEIPMTRTHLTKAFLDKAMKSIDKMESWTVEQRHHSSLIMVDKGMVLCPSLSEEEAKRLVERVKAEPLSYGL